MKRSLGWAIMDGRLVDLRLYAAVYMMQGSVREVSLLTVHLLWFLYIDRTESSPQVAVSFSFQEKRRITHTQRFRSSAASQPTRRERQRRRHFSSRADLMWVGQAGGRAAPEGTIDQAHVS